MQFDPCYEPVVMGETLFIGSPNDGSVRAYDTETGLPLCGLVLVQRVYATQSGASIAKSIHPDGSYRLAGLGQWLRGKARTAYGN